MKEKDTVKERKRESVSKISIKNRLDLTRIFEASH